MKKYYNYMLGLIMITSLIIISCDKSFLEIGPKASIDGSKFYSNDVEILQAVNGCYQSLRSLGLGPYWRFGEMRSDNTENYKTNTGGESGELVDQFVVTPENPHVSDLWSLCYNGIARCNYMLDAVDKAVGLSDANKTRYIGEVKFLRALHYFHLVRNYGGVPLRITAVNTALDAPSKGRATIEETYAQILSDVNVAVASLPSSYSGTDKGRATKGAALMMRAEIYMTQKKLTEALADLRTLQTLGYSLMTKYSDIFLPANKNNQESIFEIQYVGLSGLSSNFIYNWGPAGTRVVTGDPSTNIMDGGWNEPTDDLINAYEPGDLRKGASLSLGYTENGKYVASPYVIKFFHGYVTSGNCNDDFIIYRYADALLLIAECLNETVGVNTESFNILDQLRARAGLLPLDRVSINTKPLLRLAIEKERRVELAFENHRWYDLVRTGKAVEVMTAFGIKEKALGPSRIPPIRESGFLLTQNMLLLPIPQYEVLIDNLEQNPE